jgi:hypothetical protein
VNEVAEASARPLRSNLVQIDDINSYHDLVSEKIMAQ